MLISRNKIIILVKMENVAELVNLPWPAMNLTICQIRPVNGMFQLGLIQDKGTKDKNRFHEKLCRNIAGIIKIKRN